MVVHRFGEAEEILAVGARVHGRRAGREFDLTVEAARRHRKQWIVSFEGMRSRNEAEALAGTELLVDPEALPALPEGTYYNYQLLGLEVRTAAGGVLGRVEDIVETGARDVLVVWGNRGEVLLPSIPEVIKSVDLERGSIEVELMAGLVPEGDDEKSRGGS